MTTRGHETAARLYGLLSEISRAYQYRNRLSAGKYGVSVAEWYPLELVANTGSLSMGEVAAALHLELSTLSRIVDRLEQSGWVRRVRHDEDRRVWMITMTAAGKRKVQRVRAQLIGEYQGVFESAPAAARPAILEFLGGLVRTLRAREEEDRIASKRKPRADRR